MGAAASIGTGQRLFDDGGRPVALGSSIGIGGEGKVFELIGDRDRVAKLYHAPTPARGRKLRAMVDLRDAALSSMSTWPEYTLHGPKGGPVLGFVMARADGASLSDLLGPGSRRAQFPQTSFLFVVRAARNLAAAFATAHAAGAVIGDVKEMNAYVAEDAMVKLLDTDGFQITDRVSGEVFHTSSVTPSHQPPELQGARDLFKVTRRPEQDAFGLAVLIFQLLFMGRHPFSGTPTTRVDLEIHDAIKAGQFAWAPDLPNRLYHQPPATLGLAAVGSLGLLFTRAFLPTHPSVRPPPSEWVTALDRFERELKVCEANGAHAHLGGACVLCEVEVATGAVLFLRPRLRGPIAAPLDLAAAWAQIAAVSRPGPPPTLPTPPTVPAPAAAGETHDKYPIAAVLVIVGSCAVALAAASAVGAASWWAIVLGCVIAWMVRPQGSVAGAAPAHAVASARKRVDDLNRQWTRETGDEAFNERLNLLALALERLRVMAVARERRLQELKRDLPERQRDQYLRAHSIARAHIEGIGAKQINTLRSFRIETAYDITEFNLGWVHVFGPKLQGNLAGWRQEIEKSFRFDAALGLDSDDIRAVEEAFAEKRAADEQLLRVGPAALRQLADHVRRRRSELLSQIQAAHVELAQAQANPKARA